jgi:hypothetical protein
MRVAMTTVLAVVTIRLIFAALAVAIAVQVMGNMFEGQFGRLFAAPIGQCCTDRLGVFKSGNVVTGVAAVFGNRATAQVHQLGLFGYCFFGLVIRNRHQ